MHLLTLFPDLIKMLIKSGRHIDALNLAFAFELTEMFSPVSLLKSYIEETSKQSSVVKAGNSQPSAQVTVFLFFDDIKYILRGVEYSFMDPLK